MLDRAALAPLALAAALLAASPADAAQRPVSIACGSVGVEAALCKRGAQAWAAARGREVRVVSTPKESNEILALYQQLLAARSEDVDVLRIDVVWPGILAQHLADLGPFASEEVRAQHFPALLEAGTVRGRLVALPWFTDAGILYYRKDLLEKHGHRVPETWHELTETAQRIQGAERKAGASRMWGLVFQGRAYEGLTCDALEWIDAFGGGTLLDAQGGITARNPRAAAALALAGSWVRSIAPEGVLAYAEEESRSVFQSGNAVFMRNWPYAWALAQAEGSPVRGKVGVAPLPRGDGPQGKRSAVLGGWHLAVNGASKDVEAAADLVLFLTGRDEQKRAALEASLNPTMPALYQDRDVRRANPFMAELLPTFTRAVARPARQAGQRYNQLSSVFWNCVHEVLEGRASPDESLARLERTLKRISHDGKKW